VEVTEHYEIKDFWQLDSSSHQWQAKFSTENLDNILTDPNTRLRKMPLRIPYPLRREQDVVVHLPDNDWDLPNWETNVNHEAFSFHYRRHFSGSTVRFHYNCETKLPEVPAAEVAGYLKKREAMQGLLGDMLYRPSAFPRLRRCRRTPGRARGSAPGAATSGAAKASQARERQAPSRAKSRVTASAAISSSSGSAKAAWAACG